MRRTSFAAMRCPIARSLERVGEWWSILILRDAFRGKKRFDEFQSDLPIAPNILSRRLADLVKSGLLERQQYSERPPRYEYILTDRGRDFLPVMVSLLAWGNRHFSPEGPAVQIINAQTGDIADPILIDRSSRRPITQPEFKFAPQSPARPTRRQRPS